MPENLIIRKACAVDIDPLVRLINAGGPEDKPRQNLPEELPSTYFEAFELIDQDTNQYLMVAELNGEIVGTFQLTYLYHLAAAARPDAQLEAIHVKGALRGKGIGTTMLQWALEHANSKGVRRVQLTTDKRRIEAHSLYKRLGFTFSHQGAKLYPDK